MKSPLQEILNQALNQTLKDRLNREQRQKIANWLTKWLRDVARKKPLPDLAQRLDRFQLEIEKMTENAEIVFEAGKPVFTVKGSGDDTWKRLRLGTDWFDGDDKIMNYVMAGVADNESLSN